MPTLSRISLWHRLPSFLVIKATPGSSGPQPQLWPPWSLTLTMPRLTRPRSLQISQQTKLWYSLQHCNSSQSSYFYWGLSANLTTQSPCVISSVKIKNKQGQVAPIQTMAMSKGRIQLSIQWVQKLYEVAFVSILRIEQIFYPNFLIWMNIIVIKESRSCEIEEYRCDFRGDWLPIQFACSVC